MTGTFFRSINSNEPARFGPEEHLEPELFEAVVVVGPARLEDLVPVLVGVQLLGLVQPRQILHLRNEKMVQVLFWQMVA